MYKVLLVDDEALILNATRNNIHWERLGFELCGLASNGQEAIALIEQELPDLVITDINMPFINGLEVARYCSEQLPNTKVMILTGYDEFQYAKKALEYKVYDFILKPITAKQLSEILSKLKHELDEVRRQAQDLEKIKDVYLTHLPVIISRFLNNLVCHDHPMPDARAKLQQYALPLEGRYKLVLRIQAKALAEHIERHPEFEKELLLFLIFNVAEELIKEVNGFAFQNTAGETILLLSHDDEQSLVRLMQKQGKKIHAILKEYFDLDLLMGLSKAVQNLDELNEAFRQASRAMEHAYTAPTKFFFNASAYPETGHQFRMMQFNQDLQQLAQAIELGERELASSRLEQLKRYLLQHFGTKNKLLPYVQSIYIAMLSVPQLNVIGGDGFLERKQALSQDIEEAPHIEKAFYSLGQLSQELFDLLNFNAQDTPKRIAAQALSYLEKNYAKKDLNIAEVCAQLSISSSYFSAIFKEASGQTFVEALTQIRMQHAKQLLLSGKLKTYEIADAVGFADPHYFGVVFKKHVGMTCRAFLKQNAVL